MLDVLKAGKFHRVPVLLGSTANESYCAVTGPLKLLNITDYPDLAYYAFLKFAFGPSDQMVYNMYPIVDGVAKTVTALVSDLVFKCSTRYAAQGTTPASESLVFRELYQPNFSPAISQYQKEVYLYHFDFLRWYDGRQYINAACHSAELPYVFRSFSFINEPATPSDYKVSDEGTDFVDF